MSTCGNVTEWINLFVNHSRAEFCTVFILNEWLWTIIEGAAQFVKTIKSLSFAPSTQDKHLNWIPHSKGFDQMETFLLVSSKNNMCHVTINKQVEQPSCSLTRKSELTSSYEGSDFLSYFRPDAAPRFAIGTLTMMPFPTAGVSKLKARFS